MILRSHQDVWIDYLEGDRPNQRKKALEMAGKYEKMGYTKMSDDGGEIHLIRMVAIRNDSEKIAIETLEDCLGYYPQRQNTPQL